MLSCLVPVRQRERSSTHRPRQAAQYKKPSHARTHPARTKKRSETKNQHGGRSRILRPILGLLRLRLRRRLRRRAPHHPGNPNDTKRRAFELVSNAISPSRARAFAQSFESLIFSAIVITLTANRLSKRVLANEQRVQYTPPFTLPAPHNRLPPTWNDRKRVFLSLLFLCSRPVIRRPLAPNGVARRR